ncbi:PBS lyase HEAT domain protein repeat-containing protein [Isosphaera pallida ATCC 43644]|jgi:HEAT repeat protein|uniref:PBS lyase HEAT domain protein repeat-containing protein n=1 Tax=Isosphaera pallida (strain ATCC 43644 / DSM 9630 / IS1B) TaxID=575540 RepID=E8R605_ISOPI|nr:HEAT repeat domain-containing protein [Isosphaera pallida]ADV63907.1 PBS lyase HEAT domain protein repeat-containing protein [Isosphaera pallida ATCC 43644]
MNPCVSGVALLSLLMGGVDPSWWPNAAAAWRTLMVVIAAEPPEFRFDPLASYLQAGPEERIRIVERLSEPTREPSHAIELGTLLTAWEEADPVLADAAARSVGRLGATVALGLAEALRAERLERRRTAAAALATLGLDAAPAQEALLDLMAREPDPVARRRALVALGQLGTLDAQRRGAIRPALEALLHHADQEPDSPLIPLALTILGGWGEDAAALTGSVKTLLDRNRPAPLRLAAVETLGRIGPPAREAIPELVALLRESDLALRTAALVSLRRIGPEAIGPLTVALGGDPLWARMAALGLTSFGSQARSASDALHRMLNAKEADLRRAAARALQSIHGS